MTAASATLHAPSPPFDSGWLAVSGSHRLYYEQRGVPAGMPVLILHGGPGSGCSPLMAGFFDPAEYRVVLLDQRGAGKSLPAGGCEENTTPALIDDIEVLRRHLGIDRWLVMGGSWGATLGLLYAAAHPAQLSGLLLRNPFLARAADLDWFFGGARQHHPYAWQGWAALGVPDAPGAMLPWLAERFDRALPAALAAHVTAWHVWECALARLPSRALTPADIDLLQQRYRLQLHYFRHACFVSAGGVLAAAKCIAAANVPIHILQGLVDHVCPASATAVLLDNLPNAGRTWVEGVGHDPYHPAMQAATLQLADAFVRLNGSWSGQR
ncbi:MAG: alpha/beta fold hydrolase [Dechloromonas sp.]|nr:alpha/beta fold hydrolase [Dechloromonas sp.]